MQLTFIRGWERLCPDLRHAVLTREFYWTRRASRPTNGRSRRWEAVDGRELLGFTLESAYADKWLLLPDMSLSCRGFTCFLELSAVKQCKL